MTTTTTRDPLGRVALAAAAVSFVGFAVLLVGHLVAPHSFNNTKHASGANNVAFFAFVLGLLVALVLGGALCLYQRRAGTLATRANPALLAAVYGVVFLVVAVVAGGTARAEGYRAVDLADWQRELRASESLAPFPTLVVVTASADLDPQIATPAHGEGGPVVVATTSAAPPARLDRLRSAGVEILQRGTDAVDLAAVVDDLAGRGLPRMLCEGGPALHAALLADGLVDEVLLTLSPMLVAGSGDRTTRGPALDPAVGLSLAYALRGDDDALFTSYRTLPEKPVGLE